MDILFAKDSAKKTISLSEDTIKDIALTEVIEHLGGDSDEQKFLKKLMSEIPAEPSDMLFRQEILKDLLANESLCDALKESLTQIKTLIYFGGVRKATSDRDDSLYTLLEKLRELVVYVDTIEALYNALSSSNLSSAGLTSLRDSLEVIIKDETFSVAKKDIQVMHEDMNNVRAAIIGVNFTPDLNIQDVGAIEFVPHGIRSKYTIVDVAIGAKISNPFNKQKKVDPLLEAIAPKLQKHLGRHYGDIKRTMAKYVDYDSRFLTEMYEAFTFYLRSAAMGRRLKEKGYELSYPEIKKVEGCRISLKGFYNIRLAFLGESNIVKNDFSFTDDERIFILTGPNRGGKTIVEQSLGLISVMMSLGMFVTADKCEGLPFANIFTHFPIDENLTINYGRLGEEAIRIKEIVKSSGEDTLILFNETFSTTSSSDGLYLSKDLIRVLKEKGAYVIFNTHIHELAKEISEMDKWAGQGHITSLIMERKDDKNTFLLKRAEPDCSSYARDVALKYGITYEQLTDSTSQE